jgi:hypothetical protein
MKTLISTLVLSLALPAAEAVAQQTREDLPVEVTFRNASGDAVRGDAGGAYVHAQKNVRAILTGFVEGNLVMDTNDKRGDGGRRVLLDFPAGSGMSDGAADVFMPMRSKDLDGRDDLRTLAPGASVQKRLNINWTSGKLNYALRWNGETGAGFVTVTCTAPATTNAAAGDTCGAWTFTALDTDLVNLYSSPTKGSYKETYLATISMPHEGYIVVK